MVNYIKSSSLSSMFLFMYSIFLFPVTLYFIFTQKVMLVEWEIMFLSSSFFSFPMIMDPVGLSFSNIVCFISASVMLFSSSYMSSELFLSRFIWLMMLFVLSMNLLVFIPSIACLLLGWDGLGIVSFALVIYYQNSKSLAAGMITVLTNRIGDVLLIAAISISVIQGHWGALNMWDHSLFYLVCFCIVVAGMTKSAQVPFSSWLPAAMAAPTPVSALVHSSTLVTAGVFLLIRFFPALSMMEWFSPCLMLFSVLTLLMAGIGANLEQDMKKIIALSTLSQLGMMMLSLSLNMPMLSLFHLYTHALFKALLFLCAGAVIHNNINNQDMRMFGLMAPQMPLTISCLNVANLSLCGMPFLSGFYSKDLILEYSLFDNSNMLMLIMIFLATGMTAAYSVRMFIVVMWNHTNFVSFHQNSDEDKTLTTPMILLTIGAIVGGLFMQCISNDFTEVLIISKTMKNATMFVTGIGVWLSILIWTKKSFMMNVKSSMVNHFNSLMWFLVPLSAQPIMYFPLKVSFMIYKSVDQGWWEIMGGQGTIMLLSKSSELNQKLQDNLISTLIFMMFISMMLLMLVFM
uniref:NADH dehydrogenase subunit 5 n=1 Tax=Ennucula tenuis TaxID=106224 RepID=UPI00286AF696|nr:NADH dehydrogenase subunit 5 [Ennucula tenuis]WLV28178.1 NADH dehydrogenase subunit 5 [Ennucula tenuis]